MLLSRALTLAAAGRRLAEFFEGGAGAGEGLLIVFFLPGHRESLREGLSRGVALAVGEEGEAEFDAVRGTLGGELGGALEVTHGFGGGGVGQTAVDEFDDEARGGAERGDLVVPAAEHVMRVIVVGVEGEGLLGAFLHVTGVFELRASVGVGGEFAVADGEGEDIHGIARAEDDGALGVDERLAAEAFFFGDIGGVEGEIGILAREFLEEDGIVGARGVGLEKEVEGRFGIEASLGGERGADEGVGISGGETTRSETREHGGEEQEAATGGHQRILRTRSALGCEGETCHWKILEGASGALASRAGWGYL